MSNITAIEKELNECLKDDTELMCNGAYVVTKDDNRISFLTDDEIIPLVKKCSDNFDHIDFILAYQPYEESFEDTKKVYIDTKEKITKLNNQNFKYWNVHYDLDEMTNNDGTGWQFLCFQTISLKEQLKGDDKMSKLNEKAIDEIFKVTKDVQAIAKYMNTLGFLYHSDCWSATNIWFGDERIDCEEDILEWNRKDFEEISMDKITHFNIGGSICSGEYEYNNKYIHMPKEIEEAKGNIVKQLLQKCLPTNTKYFDFEIYDNGLENNCGWEHPIGIKATIKESALINTEKDTLTKKIAEHHWNVGEIHYDGGAFDEDVGDYYAYVELWSDLLEHDTDEYKGFYGVNSKFIEKAHKEIMHMKELEKEINNMFGKKVKTFITDWNDTIQFGCILYVYIL